MSKTCYLDREEYIKWHAELDKQYGPWGPK